MLDQVNHLPANLADLEQESAKLRSELVRQRDMVMALKIALAEHTAIARAEADGLREELAATQQLVEITRAYAAELEHDLARLKQSHAHEVSEKGQLVIELEGYRRNIFFRLIRRITG